MDQRYGSDIARQSDALLSVTCPRVTNRLQRTAGGVLLIVPAELVKPTLPRTLSD